MKPKSKMVVAVVLGLAFASIGCAKPKGACISVDGACGEGHTSGNCNPRLLRTFYEGLTCSDLGFRVTDGNENPTMGV